MTYVCGVCGNERDPDDLVVKRVQFRERGEGGKVIRTRTLPGYVCKSVCLPLDEDWNRVAYKEAAGSIAKRSATTETV